MVGGMAMGLEHFTQTLDVTPTCLPLDVVGQPGCPGHCFLIFRWMGHWWRALEGRCHLLASARTRVGCWARRGQEPLVNKASQGRPTAQPGCPALLPRP